MFPFNELINAHLEITSNCQASCPMCSRNRQGGLENPLLKVVGWSLSEFKTVMSPTVLNQLQKFFFCGNFGDPIINNDLIEMCQYAVSVNPNLNIRIHTNGSARTVKWWQDLATTLPKVHSVVFALDGLEDSHHLYRIGTDFNVILRNAKSFIDAGGNAEWCFIRFKHNEHQVEEAKLLAKKLGFSTFSVKNSSRFLLEPKVDVLDSKGNVTHIIEPASDMPLKFIDKDDIKQYKKIVSESVIDCQSYNQREVYIDAYKNVFPCCWLASAPYTYIDQGNEATEIKTEMLCQYHDLVKSLGGIHNINAVNKSLEDIVNSVEYQTVWNEYWTTKKLITCVRACGKADISKFSKSRDQQFSSINL